MLYFIDVHMWNMTSNLFLYITSKLRIYTINLITEILLVLRSFWSGHATILAPSQSTYNLIQIYYHTNDVPLEDNPMFIELLYVDAPYTTSLTHCFDQTG